jgi:hypothetical protein
VKSEAHQFVVVEARPAALEHRLDPFEGPGQAFKPSPSGHRASVGTCAPARRQ